MFHIPTLSGINKGLVIALVATFIGQTLLEMGGISLAEWLGLSTDGFFSGHLYQIATFPFVSNGLLGVLFNGLIVWFIGSELEGLWGFYRYLQFAVVTVAGQALLYLSVVGLFFSQSAIYQYPLAGMGGLCCTLSLAYGILFPDRILYLYFFPIRAKWFVAILVGISLYQALPSKGGVYAWAQLGAMASGFLWMLGISRPSSRPKRRKNHLYVVRDDKNKKTYH